MGLKSEFNKHLKNLNPENAWKQITGDWNKLEDRITGKKTEDYNASEAQKQRTWEEELANTAHQREVADLEKAGLNPILSANAGATTPTGATADAPSQTGAQNLSAILNALSAIKGTMTSAKATASQNELNNQTIKDLKNQIINRDTNTAKHIEQLNASINEIEARTKKSLEETKALEAQNKQNEDLGLTNNDKGIRREIANVKNNYLIRKAHGKELEHIENFNRGIQRQQAKAEAEFEAKTIAKLTAKERWLYYRGTGAQKRQMINLAKQRGAY